ncbi:MAG TPA: AAA family ATPase, partial [Clostridiaceae bacterium]|nr:AAA family ATPase [Clostridiaceae bacterium]
HQITVDGVTYKLKDPFMVLATQNPMEYEGTFPLPEAQLDRFMMKVNIGYPDETSELNMLKRFKEINPLTELKPVASTEDIIRIKNEVKSVMVNSGVEMYILSIVRSTRENDKILLGASPRASLNLYRASQGRAILKGRDFVTPDDVKYVSK